jgi:hypothetical protein
MFRIGMIANLLRTTLLTGATLLVVETATDGTRFARPSPAPPLHQPGHGVLFADDFSSGTLKGWTPDRLNVWSVSHGMLRADLPDQKQVRSMLYGGDTSWTNIAVDLDMCMMRGVDKGVVVRVGGVSGMGVDLRGGTYQDVLMYLRDRPMGRASATNANGAWNHVRVVASGDRFRVFVNGELKIDRPDARSARRSGRIALPAYTGGVGQCTVYYDNIVVTAIN